MPKLPKQPEINIGTAGHVDHGKSTLINALTGVWTSAHSEELKRGITIKVGYADVAFYKCSSCNSFASYGTETKCVNCKSKCDLSRVVSFVDVPGHESLMANMLSGSALTDGAILVIAANERVPQAQTQEHLLALQMLGTDQIVIVQNKVDLVDRNEAMQNFENIKKFVAGTVAENSPIIPISAQQGINIDALIDSIEKTITTNKKDTKSPPLMNVLRSFDINKPGSSIENLKGGVIGGSLNQGVLNVGDEVEIRPGILNSNNKKYDSLFTTISSLGTGSGLVDSVSPGGLVAIGTTLDPSITKSDSLLGSVIGYPDKLPPVVDSVKIETDLFDSAVGSSTMTKVDALRKTEFLRLNVGTAVTLGSVTNVNSSTIDLSLRRPISVDIGNRLALSRKIEDRWRLIGSGIVCE